MRRPKILALLAGAMGAGAMFASAPAQASAPDRAFTAHDEEAAFHAATQSRTIEALEDFLYKASQGGGKSSAWFSRAAYELAKFECIAGHDALRNGCDPDPNVKGADARSNAYGG